MPVRKKKSVAAKRKANTRSKNELVVITGMSGSGKASALKAFEDLGYYCVDNLPVELIPSFAELVKESEHERTALVVDIREGVQINKIPAIIKAVQNELNTKIVFLEAADDALIRRFSETRRPHPLGKKNSVRAAIMSEREQLNDLRNMADYIIDTSKFNVHELRAHTLNKFRRSPDDHAIVVNCISFGYKHGVPQDCDLLFDVRFLPNPHFVPALRAFTGLDAKVARYVRSFPQSVKFIDKISKLLVYLLPHYVREGKSYLTIGFGCTGGQHRSVMIAQDVRKNLASAGYKVTAMHRDLPQK